MVDRLLSGDRRVLFAFPSRLQGDPGLSRPHSEAGLRLWNFTDVHRLINVNAFSLVCLYRIIWSHTI